MNIIDDLFEETGPNQITLRDWFAAHVSVDLSKESEIDKFLEDYKKKKFRSADEIRSWFAMVEAKIRYAKADAMLKVRKE